MRKKSYINYPTYFNRMWVPKFDDDGELLVDRGVQKFVDTEKQFEQREKKKKDDGDETEGVEPKIEKPVNENEFRMSSIILNVSKRIAND